VRSAGQDLAVLGDPDLDTRQGGAHAARAHRAGPVDADHGARLRETVAFHHEQPRCAEELGDLAGERRAAGDEEPHPAAGALLDLREHERVGEGALPRQQQAR
jgi:hypothetical protein